MSPFFWVNQRGILRAMRLEEIELTSIDFEDEAFRISEDLAPAQMILSLRAVGQLNPALVLEQQGSSRYRIVCGFRRLHGLRSLGRGGAAARILPSGEFSQFEVFLRALWDNLAHRRLEPLEVARALYGLLQQCGAEEELLERNFLPLFGLSPHRNVLRSYCRLHLLHPELKRLFNAGHLTLASAEHLAQATPEVQVGVLPVWGKIRLSASRQREVLDLGADLAALSGTTLAGILTHSDILAIAEDACLSPLQRGEKIHAVLYRRRNPRLSKAKETFLAGKAALELPGTIRLSPDPYFETPRLRVEFEVVSAPAFREAVAALADAGRTAALDRLFDIS